MAASQVSLLEEALAIFMSGPKKHVAFITDVITPNDRGELYAMSGFWFKARQLPLGAIGRVAIYDPVGRYRPLHHRTIAKRQLLRRRSFVLVTFEVTIPATVRFFGLQEERIGNELNGPKSAQFAANPLQRR
jgi:hypothetical protein